MRVEKTFLNINTYEKIRLDGYWEGCKDTNNKWMFRIIVWGPIVVMLSVAFVFYIG